MEFFRYFFMILTGNVELMANSEEFTFAVVPLGS